MDLLPTKIMLSCGACIAELESNISECVWGGWIIKRKVIGTIVVMCVILIFVAIGILFISAREKNNHNDCLPTYIVAAANGYEDSLQEWCWELKEQSAYEIAVKNGYQGDRNQWHDELDNIKENVVTVVAANCGEHGELTLTLSDKTLLYIGTVAQGGTTDESAAREISHVSISEQGDLIVSFADGTQINYGTVVGAHGTADNEDASGNEDSSNTNEPIIIDVESEEDGSLTITLDNGTTKKQSATTDAQATKKTDTVEGSTTKPFVENTDPTDPKATKGTSTTTAIRQPTDTSPNMTYYTVVFRDYDESVLKSEEVEEGKSATAPAPSVRDGYMFAGWNRAFDCVTTNMVVSPIYVSSTTPTLIIPNVAGKAGETITVDVTIANNPGLLGAIITFDYDSDLSLIEAKAGPAFAELDVSFPQYKSPFTIFCDGLINPAKKDGVIVSLSFMIPEKAQKGQIFTIKASHETGDVVNNQLKETELTMIAGTVIVE